MSFKDFDQAALSDAEFRFRPPVKAPNLDQVIAQG
jgi:hypothetical protein